VKTWMRLVLAAALVASTQVSCSVNDYCLNCEKGDGGGSGSNDAGIDAGSADAAPDAGCVPAGTGEVCNGKDDDCNGLVDDGVLPQVGDLCPNQYGACAGGVYQCTGGELKCSKQPSPEVCDGIDNNCSGPIGTGTGIDEGDPGGGGKCGTDQGECIAGQFHCDPTSGTIKCFGFVDHTTDPELCNAKDDDCDGIFDEDVVITNPDCGPTTSTGECNIGTLVCQGGAPVCTNAVFPKFETCNGLDDNCDGNIDEIFNKQTDPNNCMTCGHVCPSPAKTCKDSSNVGTTCTMDSECPGGTCVENSVRQCVAGGCTFACKAGFHDIDGDPANGCEYPCFATGVEVCDGADNDCNGQKDEGLTAPAICKGLGECGPSAGMPTAAGYTVSSPPTAVCSGAGGWTCTYPGIVQFPETRCDGLDNNCDGNIDEHQKPTLGTACNDGKLGVCKGTGVYTCDTTSETTRNGDPICTITQPGSAPAAQESCNAKDDNCNGQVDEGTLLGQEWINIGNGKQMMKYEASRPDSSASDPGSSSATVCSQSGVLPWTNVKYKDALAACQAVGATLCTEQEWHRTCSVAPAALSYPINFTGTGTYIDAESYSTSGIGAIGAESACTGDSVDNDGDGYVNDGCAVVGSPELNCTDKIDNDNDGTINDGCPAQGASPEATCNESPAVGAVDNDSDGVVNDGCPAVGAPETNCRDGIDDDNDGFVNDGCPASGPAFVPDYTSGFTGISAMEATPNLGVSVSAANAPALAARLDYAINFTAGTYHIWVKMYANNVNDNTVYVGVNALPPPQAPTATVSTTTYNTWVWVDAGSFAVTAGDRYVSVYMGKDGVKVDRIYLVNGATNPGTAEPTSSAGFKWAYASSQNTYQPNTCNGHDYQQVGISTLSRASTGVVTVTTSAAHPFVVGGLVQITGTANVNLGFEGDYTVTSVANSTTFTYQQLSVAATNTTGGTATDARDNTLTTGFLCNCKANTDTGAFDMSGNVREWTLAHAPGENPIRGGAANGTADGISCPLNFTLADDTFFFPNIGFRCCRTFP